MNALLNSRSETDAKTASDAEVWEAFRRWGYLEARLDPLGHWLQPMQHPDLRVTGLAAEAARQVYSAPLARSLRIFPIPNAAAGLPSKWSLRPRRRIVSAYSNVWFAPIYSSRSCRPAT